MYRHAFIFLATAFIASCVARVPANFAPEPRRLVVTTIYTADHRDDEEIVALVFGDAGTCSDDQFQHLHTITVAAVTSTLRGAPTEVEVGVDEGLKKTSCVNLCNVFTVTQQELVRFVGSVTGDRMAKVCRALVIACGCD